MPRILLQDLQYLQSNLDFSLTFLRCEYGFGKEGAATWLRLRFQ